VSNNIITYVVSTKQATSFANSASARCRAAAAGRGAVAVLHGHTVRVGPATGGQPAKRRQAQRKHNGSVRAVALPSMARRRSTKLSHSTQ